MNNTIKNDSREYQEVKAKLSKAANNGNLVIFIGAGISKLCGFPLWNETCDKLIDHCVGKHWLSKEEGEQIRKCSDPIMKMSQCRKHITEEAFDQFLKGVFGKDVPEEYSENYQRLKNALGALSSVIVTTNIDEIFDCLCLDENRFYSTEHIENIKIIKGIKQIWHIHGSVRDITVIVFTEEQYKERYSDEKVITAFKRFFDSNNCTVLFVGYGLGDTELLPYFEGDLKNRNNHFFLEGHNKDNDEEFKKKCKKCDERGIQVLEYDLEDGKYEKVIDVLENLAEYMNLESTYPSVRFDDISSRLMDVPDKESIACVCNEVNSLLPQHQSWLLHDALRHGCDPEWIIVFLKDSKLKQLFSIDNDIPSDDSDDKEPWNIKNIRFLLDGYRNRKSSILLPYIEEIVIGLVKRMETDKKLFKNKGILLCIISNSFISEKVISEPSMLAFWKKMARLKKRNYYHHFFLAANDNLLKCSEEVRESYFDFMLDVVLKKSGCLNVINGEDINNILPFFGDDKVLERFKKIKRKTIKRDKEKAGPFSGWRGSPDCFENIRMKRCGSNEEYYANEYSAIRIMIHEMTQIDEGKTIAVYNDLRKRSSLLDINLSIYFCNLRFDVLKDVFFNNIFDYCDYKNRLEVYSLLHSHKDEIGAEYIDKIYRYILRIIEETDTRFIFDCKLIISFCELFENRCPKLKMQKEKIMASISEKGKKAMKKITDVLDCTGDKGMAILEDCDEEEAETKITDLKTWCGLLRFVKTNNYDDFSSDIEKWMVTHFDLCELETFLFDSAFSLETYPVGFINDCFKLYMSRNEVQEKKLVMYFDKIKVDSRNLKLVQAFSNYLVRNLSWMCSVSAQFKNFWRDLFDYSIRHRQSFFFDDSWFKSSSVYASRGFNLLCFLIWMADKDDWDKLKVVFHETITEGNDDSVVIRAAYIFSMKKIYTLDQEYLYSILHSIFYGSYQDMIVDIFLNHNQITEPSFFDELYSQGILSLIVSYQSKIDGAAYLLSFLVTLFIEGKISEKVLDTVLSDFKEINIAYGGIGDLEKPVNELNEDEVKRIKTVLTKIKEVRDVCFDALVILLLEMMKSSSLLKKYIWEDVMELAKRGFRDTYLGEVKKYFCEESFLTNKEKIILLESVLKKGEINELYNKEMIQIFDSIDWSKDKDRFHELIVIIQRQDMELSGQLITQFHLKYEKSDDCAVKDENA